MAKRRYYALSNRNSKFFGNQGKRIRLCGQDRIDVQDGQGRKVLFSFEASPLRQEPAHQYVGGLFPWKERTVLGAGRGGAGEGLGGVSCAASGFEY